MTIFVEDKLKPGVIGTNLADAIDIDATGNLGSVVQDAVDNISDFVLRQTFDNTVGDDPAPNSFSRDNADRTLATNIYTDLNWNEGTFNEFLLDVPTNTYLYLQSLTSPENNILYRTTGPITAGTNSSWFNIPVAFVRNEGDDFSNSDDVSFRFLVGPQSTTIRRETPLPTTFTEDLTITQGNIDTALIAPLYYSAARDKTDVQLIFRIAGLTQDGNGNSLRYPLEFFVGHTGGTRRTVGTNTFTVEFQDQNNANAIIQIRASSSSTLVNSRTLFQGDQFAYRIDSANATEITEIRTATTDPRGTVRFDLNDTITIDASSPTRFQQSLSGEIPDAGEQYLVRVGGNPFDGVEVNAGDVMEATVANPGVVSPDGWAVIRRSLSFPVTALESRFLGGITEQDEVSIGTDYADEAGEIRLKLYSTQGGYSAADLNTTGDIDVYTNPTDLGSHFLAIRLTGTNTTLANVLPVLYAVIDRSDGTQEVFGNLSTDFTFQGNFGAESDYLSDTTLNYFAGDSIRVYRGTELAQFSIASYDSTENLPDNGIVESKLSNDVRLKLNNQSGNDNVFEQRVRNLETKMDALFPLTPDVADLNSWASTYSQENTTQIVRITRGYSLLADYRGDATRYESAGVVYDSTGTNVIRYTGLSNDLHRAFGYKVTAPANTTLMWIVEGAELIPFIDMTSGGNFRINQYTFSETAGDIVTNRPNFLSLTSGTATLAAGETNTATYTITPFPAGATNASRIAQIGVEVLVNGSDTNAEHLEQLATPNDLTAQARRTFTANVYLGPLHGNRTVAVVMSYEFRVSGSDLLLDVKYVSGPSDVTIAVRDVATELSYTAASTVTRTDSFATFTDAGGTYTFSGEAEFLVSFHPLADGNTMDAVPVVRQSNGTVVELNDIAIPEPENGFASVEIPDTIDFRTFESDHYFRHADLSALVARTNTQWVYGLAELVNISEDQVTDLIDFTSGIVLISPNSSRYRLTVDNAGTLTTVLEV